MRHVKGGCGDRKRSHACTGPCVRRQLLSFATWNAPSDLSPTHPPSASTSSQPQPPPSTCEAYPYSSTLAIDIRDLPSQTPVSLYTAGVPTTNRQTFSRRFRYHTTRAGQQIHPAPTFPVRRTPAHHPPLRYHYHFHPLRSRLLTSPLTIS